MYLVIELSNPFLLVRRELAYQARKTANGIAALEHII